MVLPLSSDRSAVAGGISGSWTLAHAAELSPFGEVARPSGKGCGENYRSSWRLSPLADNWPNWRLPNWDPAEGLKGGACPGTGAQQNRLALGGAWPECSTLAQAYELNFLSLFKPNPFFIIILFIFLACFLWVKTVQQLFQSRGLWVNLEMWKMIFRFKWGVSGDRNSPVSPDAAGQSQGSVRLAVPVEQMLEMDNGVQLLLQAAVFIFKGWADYFGGTGHDSALMFFSVAASLLQWCPGCKHCYFISHSGKQWLRGSSGLFSHSSCSGKGAWVDL